MHRQVTQGDKQLLEIGNNMDTGYQTIDLINKEVALDGREKPYQTIEEDVADKSRHQPNKSAHLDLEEPIKPQESTHKENGQAAD